MIEHNQTSIMEQNDVAVISHKKSEAVIYEELKGLLPESVYNLSKILNIPYTTLKMILKKLENADLLKSEMVINKENRATRIWSLK